MPGTACNRGFTLIELLLAMTISVFIAVIGYQGLTVSIDASTRVTEETAKLADLELALGILEQDISQSIARPVRNELGGLDPVMVGGFSNDSILTFTRDGWSNPRLLKRSELARINYQWQEQSLVRQRWSILDRIGREEGLDEIVLLEGVDDLRMEFFSPFSSDASTQSSDIDRTRRERPISQNNSADADSVVMGEWVDFWSSERLGLDFTEPLPSAIRITLSINGFGQVSRIFVIPAA